MSCVPFKMKRLLLICDVQNDALSGLEAFVISEVQCARLDSVIARVARRCLRGRAVSRDETGCVISGMCNLDVLHFWRIGTSSTELVIRRLKWLQAMALHPEAHHLVLCAFFAVFR